MAKAVAAAPVPIRLAYRYPNGCMISYSARATLRDDDSVHVIVNEEFDEGIQLSVMAPFLGGLTAARVRSVKRSRKTPGYFEVVLQIGDSAVASPGPAEDADQPSRGSHGTANGEGPIAEEPAAAKQHAAAVAAAVVPGLVVEAAEKLAYELRKLPTRKISEVLEEIPSEWRSMSLLVAIAATIHLLEAKGHVDSRRLFAHGPGHAREVVKK
ncbi:MAG: hypothetical protein HY651_03575 [Acidobacteria bacterium]|nr:hypothetical protein [Acidobacteriota bacterium]